MIQACLGVGTLALTLLVARRWFGPAEAVVSGVLLVGYGATSRDETALLSAALATFLAVLLAWLVDRATMTPRGVMVRGRAWFALAAGLIAGALALVQVTLLVAGLMITAGLLWSTRRRGSRRALPWWYAAGLGLALSPTVANTLGLGTWAPITANGGFEFSAGHGNLSRLLGLPLTVIFLLGTAGLALAVLPGHRRRGSALAPVALILAVIAAAVLAAGHRLPAVPFLAVYAGHALVRGAQLLRHKPA